MPSIDRVDEILALFDERTFFPVASTVFLPIRRTQVFADVQPIFGNVRKEELKRSVLLRHSMTAVVNENIDPGQLSDERSEEVRIALIPDENSNALSLQMLTVWIDVETIDLGQRTEVVFPHLKGAAMFDANFQEMNFGPTVGREVSVINGKVVCPLVNEPVLWGIEVAFEVIHA